MQTEQQRQEFVRHVKNLISTLAQEGATLTYFGERKQGYAPYRSINIVMTHPQETQWYDLRKDEKIAVLRYMLRDYPGFVFDGTTEDVLLALVERDILKHAKAYGRALFRGMTQDNEVYALVERLTEENKELRRENEELRRENGELRGKKRRLQPRIDL